LNKKIGVIKMRKAWNAMKEKRFEKKTQKLEEKALHYLQENEKLERHIVKTLEEIPRRPQEQKENLTTTEITTNSADGKSLAVKKKKSIKFEDHKAGHDKEEFSHATRPDELREEDTKPNITLSEENEKKTKGEGPTREKTSLTDQNTSHINKRTRKRSRKRCHLCRKRGHIKKECPFSPVLQDWS